MENNDYEFLNDYLNEDNKSKKYFKNFINRVLISLVILIISLIFVKISDKNKELYKKYVFGETFKFSTFNKFYEKYFGSVLGENKTQTMFNEINYNDSTPYLNGIKIKAENQNINTLTGGVVIFSGTKEGYGNTVIIQGSDGFDIWYGNLENVNVKIYDYVSENSLIGSSLNSIYLVITKDNKYYTYEEYIQNKN